MVADIGSSVYLKTFRDVLKGFYALRYSAPISADYWASNRPLLMNDVYRLGRLLHADSALCQDKTVRLFIFGDFFQLVGSGILWAFAFKGAQDRHIRVASANLYSADHYESIVSLQGGFKMDGRSPLEQINFYTYHSDVTFLKNEIRLIGGDSSKVGEYIAAFEASHCIFLSATDGEFALLFHLLNVSLSQAVRQYFFTQTIAHMLNKSFLVLPDISGVDPIIKCFEVSAVVNGQIQTAKKQISLYRFTQSEIAAHNPNFSAALDSYMFDGNTNDLLIFRFVNECVTQTWLHQTILVVTERLLSKALAKVVSMAGRPIYDKYPRR